jgi:hypothetical protein
MANDDYTHKNSKGTLIVYERDLWRDWGSLILVTLGIFNILGNRALSKV